MSLIQCSECGKEISEYSTVCVHCGCPMSVIQKVLFACVEREICFTEVTKHIRIIYNVDTYPDGADIFAYDYPYYEQQYPGITPSLLVSFYVFNHEWDFNDRDVKAQYNRVDEFNNKLISELNRTWPERVFTENEVVFAKKLFGLDTEPISQNILCETFYPERPYSGYLLMRNIFVKLLKIFDTNTIEMIEYSDFYII